MKKLIAIMILLLSTVCAYADETSTATTANANEINIDAQYGPYSQNEYQINDRSTPFYAQKTNRC